MRVLDIIGIMLPLMIILLGAIILCADLINKIRSKKDFLAKIAPKFKPSFPERYLVVCHNKKWAKCLWRDLCEYLSKEDIKFRYFENGPTYNIDIIGQDITVRFVSEYSFYEVSRGFHGWVVDDSYVEKYLDNARQIEKLKEEYSNAPDSVDDAIQ